jgi:hypothetical protein
MTPVFTGYTVDGGFAEYVLARADFMFPLPDNLDEFHRRGRGDFAGQLNEGEELWTTYLKSIACRSVLGKSRS